MRGEAERAVQWAAWSATASAIGVAPPMTSTVRPVSRGSSSGASRTAATSAREMGPEPVRSASVTRPVPPGRVPGVRWAVRTAWTAARRSCWRTPPRAPESDATCCSPPWAPICGPSTTRASTRSSVPICGPSSRPRTRENHRVGTRQMPGDLVAGGLLQIHEPGLGPSLLQHLGLGRVADEAGDRIAAPGQQLLQEKGDLAVPSGDHDLHDQAGRRVSRTKLTSMSWPGKNSDATPMVELVGRWSPK